jgi:hypothetical protein
MLPVLPPPLEINEKALHKAINIGSLREIIPSAIKPAQNVRSAVFRKTNLGL